MAHVAEMRGCRSWTFPDDCMTMHACTLHFHVEFSISRDSSSPREASEQLMKASAVFPILRDEPFRSYQTLVVRLLIQPTPSLW